MYVRVSQDSTDTLPLSLSILGLSYVCQSIPGFHRYFTKGVCVSWDNPIPRILYQGAPVTEYPGIILCMSEYPKIPRILYQRGRCHCLSLDNPMYVRVSQYFIKGVSCPYVSWDNPMYFRVSQDSTDTLPRGPCH